MLSQVFIWLASDTVLPRWLMLVLFFGTFVAVACGVFLCWLLYLDSEFERKARNFDPDSDWAKK